MRSTISLFFVLCVSMANAQVGIIPQPVELRQSQGTWLLKDKVTVSNNFPETNWKKLFPYFRDEMRRQFNVVVSEAAKGTRGDIDFTMARMETSGKPAYKLNISGWGVSIKSNFEEPAFHAMQTLFQLIPSAGEKMLPLVDVFDYARFEYRGMHLDVARHFFPVSFIKRYIDYLAYHKLNTFHWHLTDDQGWRIEIKKYPKLTSVGGWRNGTIIGRYPGTGNDGQRYGGFYTQEEVKEVVKYATERFINVIPEIEMPGHASAAIAAYPELSCFPKEPTIKYYPKECKWYGDSSGKQVQQTWGVFNDVFCAGREKTFTFLQDVLNEVLPLFPSKYIHVGGDECPKENWKRCIDCQRRMKDQKLKDEHELQSYFIQRMEKYLNSKGKTLIGWDEILEGGLAPNAVVMSWRGEKGGIEAAKQKHKVIMTPGNPVYFDHTQSENEDSVTIGGFNPIEKVYEYDPIPKELNVEEAKYIIGAQANLWAEYLKNTRKVEYMLFPRLSALSEVLWSPKEKRDWDEFQTKLQVQFKRYDAWQANYSTAFFDLKTSVSPGENGNGVNWNYSSRTGNTSYWVKYTKVSESHDTVLVYDINDPSKVKGYKIQKPGDTVELSHPIAPDKGFYHVKSSGVYTISAHRLIDREHHQVSEQKPYTSIRQKFSFNIATGKKITLKEDASKKYPGEGAFTLVNGVINEKGFQKSREFLGFEGEDCEAVIDLGVKTEFKQVTVNSLTSIASWIYPPRYATFLISDDGVDFKEPEGRIFSDIEPYQGRKTRLRSWQGDSYSARYIKVIVKNYGKIPDGKPGAGNKAWLFVDEIEVE